MSGNSFTGVGTQHIVQQTFIIVCTVSHSQLAVYYMYTFNSGLVTCTQVERVLVIISRNCDTVATVPERGIWLSGILLVSWLIVGSLIMATLGEKRVHIATTTHLAWLQLLHAKSALPLPAHTPHSGAANCRLNLQFPNNLAASVMKSFTLR